MKNFCNNIFILKQFDGEYNYFNCTGINEKRLYRREKKYNGLLISDIIDDNNDIVLSSYIENDNIISFEDPRYITENKFSVSKVIYKNGNIFSVNFQIYDIESKKFTYFNISKNKVEKNWQVYEDVLIYHIDPWIVYDLKDLHSNVIKKSYNFDKWIDSYGDIYLSSNIFNIDGFKFLFFHSKCSRFDGKQLNYFQGILRLSNDLEPIAYTSFAYLFGFSNFNSTEYAKYYDWKISLRNDVTMVDSFFINNVDVINDRVHIYGGINDCNSVVLILQKNEFLNNLKEIEWSMLF